MQYWLMKSEPDDVSIDDLAAEPQRAFPWTGVRNYQARNFMRDAMQVGDLAFFYHAGCAEPGIAGICEICSESYPDPTQFVAVDPYFDPKSTRENPRWWLRDVRFAGRGRYLSLGALRACPELATMRLLARGNRLSITPVSVAEWNFIAGQLLGRHDLTR
ncbi:EVE domain-containing protein [Azonexus fungiphilus]|jgi:predicted RNA-binding protein with PUA-like domain|uniref:EVE domain-containing protein n=1 Tax=Azonexus fungiphilus TaxID=146940 RepID=UPI00156B621D|nr:EVE domain-containing protein [Azonexus fungiphilus]NHC08504.1 EVE domain-containing protein [Azonexus fungiphilus]